MRRAIRFGVKLGLDRPFLVRAEVDDLVAGPDTARDDGTAAVAGVEHGPQVLGSVSGVLGPDGVDLTVGQTGDCNGGWSVERAAGRRRGRHGVEPTQ